MRGNMEVSDSFNISENLNRSENISKSDNKNMQENSIDFQTNEFLEPSKIESTSTNQPSKSKESKSSNNYLLKGAMAICRPVANAIVSRSLFRGMSSFMKEGVKGPESGGIPEIGYEVKTKRYKNVDLSDDNNTLTITKINKKGEEVIRLYEKVGTLGEGGMGSVSLYKPLDDSEHKSKAVKLIFPQYARDYAQKNFDANNLINGIMFNPTSGEPLRAVPGLLPLKYIDSVSGLAISALADGDLDQNKIKDFNEFCNFAAQSAFGLNHMHQCGVVHHDIKGANFLRRDNEFYLIDFDGVHKRDEKSNLSSLSFGCGSSSDRNIIKSMSTKKGSLKSKEIPKFHESLDVKGLGVLWREQLTGKDLTDFVDGYSGIGEIKNPLNVEDVIFKDDLNPSQLNRLKSFCELTNKMTSKDWSERPTMSEVFAKINDIMAYDENFKMPQYPSSNILEEKAN